MPYTTNDIPIKQSVSAQSDQKNSNFDIENAAELLASLAPIVKPTARITPLLTRDLRRAEAQMLKTHASSLMDSEETKVIQTFVKEYDLSREVILDPKSTGETLFAQSYQFIKSNHFLGSSLRKTGYKRKSESSLKAIYSPKKAKQQKSLLDNQFNMLFKTFSEISYKENERKFNAFIIDFKKMIKNAAGFMSICEKYDTSELKAWTIKFCNLIHDTLTYLEPEFTSDALSKKEASEIKGIVEQISLFAQPLPLRDNLALLNSFHFEKASNHESELDDHKASVLREAFPLEDNYLTFFFSKTPSQSNLTLNDRASVLSDPAKANQSDYQRLLRDRSTLLSFLKNAIGKEKGENNIEIIKRAIEETGGNCANAITTEGFSVFTPEFFNIIEIISDLSILSVDEDSPTSLASFDGALELQSSINTFLDRIVTPLQKALKQETQRWTQNFLEEKKLTNILQENPVNPLHLIELTTNFQNALWATNRTFSSEPLEFPKLCSQEQDRNNLNMIYDYRDVNLYNLSWLTELNKTLAPDTMKGRKRSSLAKKVQDIQRAVPEKIDLALKEIGSYVEPKSMKLDKKSNNMKEAVISHLKKLKQLVQSSSIVKDRIRTTALSLEFSKNYNIPLQKQQLTVNISNLEELETLITQLQATSIKISDLWIAEPLPARKNYQT